MKKRLLPLAGILLALSACVRVETPRQEYSKTRLMIAKDVNGVQLQWQSEKNLRYAILYQDPAASDPRWQVLPSHKEVVGSGKMMLILLTGPEAMRRDYRIQALVGIPQGK